MFSGNMVCFTTDKQMGYPCEINVVDARVFNTDNPVFKIPIPANGPKVSSMIWSGLDSYLLTGKLSFKYFTKSPSIVNVNEILSVP